MKVKQTNNKIMEEKLENQEKRTKTKNKVTEKKHERKIRKKSVKQQE